VNDHEYVSPDGVAVDKVGGGTVGRRYSQEHWMISTLDNGSWSKPERMYVGRPANHGEVAAIARDFLTLREAL
jgi:hypothetical protein